MNANFAVLEKIQKNPTSNGSKDAHIDATFGSVDFDSTAWRTAQATGALAYMPYEQAQRFSGIYDDIAKLEKSQQVMTEDEAQFLGIIRRYSSKSDDVSKQQADAMAERFGIWQGHLLVVHIAARVLQEGESAFLEHREPNHHMSEKLNN